MNKPTYEELEAQVKQLAAENAALKSYRPQPQGAAVMEALDAFFEHEDVPEQGMMAALEILRCKRPRTPATDAILASLRAEGVEMFVESCKSRLGQHVHPFASVGYSAVVELGSQFAAQLRSKSEVQS